jgi:hypothetical protein
MIDPEQLQTGGTEPGVPPPPRLDLPSAHRYVEYLKKLSSWMEAERELQGKSPDELRAMVLIQLAREKRRQLAPGHYERWSREEPL